MSSMASWLRLARDDATRERATAINQLLLGLAALITTVVIAIAGAALDVALLMTGVLLFFVMTGVALVVPWNRLPPLVVAVVPLVDVVAILLMELSSPAAGFASLWVFPSLWLAVSFGMVGLCVGVTLTSLAYWITAVIAPVSAARTTLVLLPLQLAAISAVAYLTSRRAVAQRVLLAKQSTSLEHALDRAKRQENLVTGVLDAVDFGVVRIGEDGATTVANEAHARLQAVAGPSSDDGARAVYAPDGITALSRDDEPIVRAGRGETFESELVWYGAPGAQRRALSVTSRPLRGPDGADAGGLVVSRDVTAEVTALRAREDLIASVSHELRTPLTSILGYVDLVLDADDLSPGARANLEVVERNATRLLSIVSDILSASADARGGIALTVAPERTELDGLVRAAIDGIGRLAAERSITIDVSGIEPVTAWVDPLRMRQVVDNLLSNAVKYHHEGGRVDVGVTHDEDHAWVVVRDDGPGIRSDELPLLFDRFYRADAVRHTSAHGTGLGLAISREIMRAQGGEITVTSEVGAGSTFVVRVPMRETKKGG